MPQYVPDSIYFYEADEDNMIQALLNNIVVSGCAVAERSPQIMGVRVAAGVIFGDGARVAVSQTDIVIAANSSGSNRLDLISVHKVTGVPTVTAGTPAATPIPPSLPSTDLLLAYINVANNAANIQAANITDRRLQIPWRIGAMTFANLPAVGKAGQLGVVTDPDLPELYRDDGAAWRSVTNRYPNLVLNSDYGRRTVWTTFMPERFVDATAWTGGSLSAASNQLTQATGSVWSKWAGPNTAMWRDGRWSAQLKFQSASWIFGKYIDANDALTTGNAVYVQQDAGTFYLRKCIAGTNTTVTSVAVVPVVGNWYWVELESQGTVYTAKIYSSGAAAVAKASATLLATLTGTINDAGVVLGGVGLWSSATNSIWGGLNTGDGGVYVEGWAAEGWTVTHTGTIGGQGFSFDDAADSGPLGKQWCPRVYIPAASRTMTVLYSGPDGGMVPATPYAYSYYLKTTGLGGSGVMLRGSVIEQNSAAATQATNSLDDAAEAVYTRKTGTFTTNAATRRFAFQFLVNQGAARTGTVRFSLPQVELGTSVSAWRPAAVDEFAPINWDVWPGFSGNSPQDTNYTTTSVTAVEIDPRDLAIEIFLPYDAVVLVQPTFTISNVTGGQYVVCNVLADGVTSLGNPADLLQQNNGSGSLYTTQSGIGFFRLAAGRHRITCTYFGQSSTSQIANSATFARPHLHVTAFRGQ